MVLLPLFDESQIRLADFGYIPECKSKNPRGLNEISLTLAINGVNEVMMFPTSNQTAKIPGLF